jgi:hypothetical protein
MRHFLSSNLEEKSKEFSVKSKGSGQANPQRTEKDEGVPATEAILSGRRGR